MTLLCTCTSPKRAHSLAEDMALDISQTILLQEANCYCRETLVRMEAKFQPARLTSNDLQPLHLFGSCAKEA